MSVQSISSSQVPQYQPSQQAKSSTGTASPVDSSFATALKKAGHHHHHGAKSASAVQGASQTGNTATTASASATGNVVGVTI